MHNPLRRLHDLVRRRNRSHPQVPLTLQAENYENALAELIREPTIRRSERAQIILTLAHARALERTQVRLTRFTLALVMVGLLQAAVGLLNFGWDLWLQIQQESTIRTTQRAE